MSHHDKSLEISSLDETQLLTHLIITRAKHPYKYASSKVFIREHERNNECIYLIPN